MERANELTTIERDDIVVREVSSQFDRDTPNSDLIRMSCKAFGWEVNRNSFQHKKKVLKRTVEDAFGNKLPLYRTFEGKLVDRNHLMKDSGSRQDNAIGYIESASIKEDGVYFDMWIWKRCITDEEQRQIRDSEVSVSMEVDFSDPVCIIDGNEEPSTPTTRAVKGAVRSYADNATINGLGIAVLFDGITPGYASAKVIATENAVADTPVTTTNDTVPPEVLRGSESATAEQTPEEEPMEIEDLKAQLAQRETELASANEALASKVAELDKIYAEMQQIRVDQFNQTVAASFDLGGLAADTAGWLLDMLRWSGDVESTAAKLCEVSGCVKRKPKEAAVEEAPAVVAEEAPVTPEEASTEAPVTTEDAAVTEEAPAGEPETVTESAATTPLNIAAGNAATFGTEAPKWGIEHL